MPGLPSAADVTPHWARLGNDRMRWFESRSPPSQDSLHNVLEGQKEAGAVFAPERCIVATALALALACYNN